MKNNGQVVLCYGSNINGSTENIAGICDPSGLVFGLMPHPEAFMWGATANKKMDIHTKGDGYQLFENIIRYIREK
jgi:phosphoribosylformylglycinamidine synthase